ncbi:MAG TPA: ABC transporter, partial [Myxococcaceae bacterium]|nr:ABC transporter [Myxococcaceae bacterium]
KAGSTKPADEGRAIALADSDALADVLLDNPGNMYFALDGIKWLLGDESLAGEIATEVDVSVEHTRKQDVLWFYSTVFAAPAIVLGIGLLVTRRRRRGTASGATTGNREDAP